jgi:hypothetical protein
MTIARSGRRRPSKAAAQQSANASPREPTHRPRERDRFVRVSPALRVVLGRRRHDTAIGAGHNQRKHREGAGERLTVVQHPEEIDDPPVGRDAARHVPREISRDTEQIKRLGDATLVAGGFEDGEGRFVGLERLGRPSEVGVPIAQTVQAAAQHDPVARGLCSIAGRVEIRARRRVIAPEPELP